MLKMSERRAAGGKFARCSWVGPWPRPLPGLGLQAANAVVQSLIWLVIHELLRNSADGEFPVNGAKPWKKPWDR